uniref:Uncharacterized protein n=1 Tax=Cacopsylla melanoneura TaxID=428564 RepID=A0A8D8RKK7_9HEMI
MVNKNKKMMNKNKNMNKKKLMMKKKKACRRQKQELSLASCVHYYGRRGLMVGRKPNTIIGYTFVPTTDGHFSCFFIPVFETHCTTMFCRAVHPLRTVARLAAW